MTSKVVLLLSGVVAMSVGSCFNLIQGLTYVYGSEHGNCMIFPDTFYSLEDSLYYLQMHNVSKPLVLRWTCTNCYTYM